MENVSVLNTTEINVVSPASDFLNGNTVITPKVSGYVTAYKSFLRKTAESVIGLASTLVEAETSLSVVDFEIFCRQVKLEKGSPTHTKLKKIGEKITRFNPFIEKLPNTWTTLYKLATLESSEFDRVSMNLTPFISAKEIDLLVKGETVKGGDKADITIGLKMLDSASKLAVYEEFEQLQKKYSIKMLPREDFVKEIATIKQQKQAA